MALNLSTGSNLEQLELKGFNIGSFLGQCLETLVLGMVYSASAIPPTTPPRHSETNGLASAMCRQNVAMTRVYGTSVFTAVLMSLHYCESTE